MALCTLRWRCLRPTHSVFAIRSRQSVPFGKFCVPHSFNGQRVHLFPAWDASRI